MIITDCSVVPTGKPAHLLRITLDTNVWLDWLVFTDPLIHPIQTALQAGEIVLVGHRQMRDEIAQVLGRLVWQKRPLQTPVEVLLQTYDSLVITSDAVQPPARWKCRDPDDQMYIDWLVAGSTDGVFTKDKALLRMATTLSAAGKGWIKHPRLFRSN